MLIVNRQQKMKNIYVVQSVIYIFTRHAVVTEFQSLTAKSSHHTLSTCVTAVSLKKEKENTKIRPPSIEKYYKIKKSITLKINTKAAKDRNFKKKFFSANDMKYLSSEKNIYKRKVNSLSLWFG